LYDRIKACIYAKGTYLKKKKYVSSSCVFDIKKKSALKLLDSAVCVCVCVCVYIYIYTHIYMCVCVYIYTHTFICVYVYIYIHTHTHTHTYTYICVCVCIYIYTHTCNIVYSSIFWRNSPQWVTVSSFTRFLNHTQRRITVSRTPLDE